MNLTPLGLQVTLGLLSRQQGLHSKMLPQRVTKPLLPAPPWKLAKADLPEPRRLLLQKKALGLQLVNIVPTGGLSLMPASNTFSFLPSTSSLPENKGIPINAQEHAN